MTCSRWKCNILIRKTCPWSKNIRKNLSCAAGDHYLVIFAMDHVMMSKKKTNLMRMTWSWSFLCNLLRTMWWTSNLRSYLTKITWSWPNLGIFHPLPLDTVDRHALPPLASYFPTVGRPCEHLEIDCSIPVRFSRTAERISGFWLLFAPHDDAPKLSCCSLEAMFPDFPGKFVTLRWCHACEYSDTWIGYLHSRTRPPT